MAYIIPEIFADAVNAARETNLRAGLLATDYTEMVADITTCGDKIHFPTIDNLTDAVVVTPGTPLDAEEPGMTDNEATVKQVGKAVRIFDKYSTQVKGNMKDNLANQIGYKLAKAVDTDLVAEIRANAAYKKADQVGLTEYDVEEAFDVFGDGVDNDEFAGILINSRLRKKFAAMDAFTDANKTFAAAGNGIVRNGLIGYWRGTIPVYVSDNGTYALEKSMMAIVKNGALGVIWQQAPTTEEEREAKLLATDIVASEMYAAKLLHANGVSLVEVAANS